MMMMIVYQRGECGIAKPCSKSCDARRLSSQRLEGDDDGYNDDDDHYDGDDDNDGKGQAKTTGCLSHFSD